MEKIDFVITWVDGSDPEWLAEKNKYKDTENIPVLSTDDANADCRYRADYDLLRYWFRGVEQYAPWVNKIHFVTCGQKPEWLNDNHPKLNLVNHHEYIPKKYLPTFNANVIEMNFHCLSKLSECFVFFNDDMFLLKPVEPSFFFKNNSPVLPADLRYPKSIGYNNWSRLVFNDYCIVNNTFDMFKSIWNNRKKWFNIQELGMKRVRQNILCYLANKSLPIGTYGHLANPHLKSSFTELWDRWPDVMDNTCVHKFRSDDQVNQWLLCAWNQAKGRFSPIRDNKRGKCFKISPTNIDEIVQTIEKQLFPQVCLNDTLLNTDNDVYNERICSAFNSILPSKSTFEK